MPLLTPANAKSMSSASRSATSHWTGRPNVGLARPPAHRLAKGNASADLCERPRQELARGAPLVAPPPDDVATRLLFAGDNPRLGRRRRPLDDRERLDRDPELGGERLSGLGGLAVLERRRLGRADDLLVEIGLVRFELVDDHRQAARRAERADVTVGKSQLGELGDDDVRERGEGGVDERGGQLFGADFEEQVRHEGAGVG